MKLTLIDDKNNLFKKSYVRRVLLLVVFILIITIINDYLAISFTSIKLN